MNLKMGMSGSKMDWHSQRKEKEKRDVERARRAVTKQASELHERRDLDGIRGPRMAFVGVFLPTSACTCSGQAVPSCS
jgi:hypothetical protein